MALADAFGQPWAARFSYERVSPDTLTIHGRVDGVPFRATLHREDTSDMELVQGRINLISEHPH